MRLPRSLRLPRNDVMALIFIKSTDSTVLTRSQYIELISIIYYSIGNIIMSTLPIY